MRPDHAVRIAPTSVAATRSPTYTSESCHTMVKSVGVPGGCGLMPWSMASATRRGPYWSAKASNATRMSTPRIGQRFGQSSRPSENGFSFSSTTCVNGTSWSSYSGSRSSRPWTRSTISGGMPANCVPGAVPHTAPCALGGGPIIGPPPKPSAPHQSIPPGGRSGTGSGGGAAPLPSNEPRASCAMRSRRACSCSSSTSCSCFPSYSSSAWARISR